MADSFPFVKGHGTENDFVLLPDPDGSLHGDLAPDLVVSLCDRRAGIGGDGVIRVIRSAAYDDPAAVACRHQAEWFMDYRNADGSVSEMCGNGVRVLARYLADRHGVDTSQPIPVGTRAGLRVLHFCEDGSISAEIGRARVLGETSVSLGASTWPAVHVNLGNPHAVAFVDSLEGLGPLLTGPSFDSGAFPQGVNVEFVVRRGPRHVAMRVHERGSGETRSCGTGACAVAVAAALADGRVDEEVRYRVDVPGGSLEVTCAANGEVALRGPAVIVACGEVPMSFANIRAK